MFCFILESMILAITFQTSFIISLVKFNSLAFFFKDKNVPFFLSTLMRLFKVRLSTNIRTGFISGWEEKLHLELKGEHLKSFSIIYSCSFWFFLLYIDLHEHKRTSWMLYKGFIMLPFSVFKMHLLNWPIFHHLRTCREKIIFSPLALMIMEHLADLGKKEAPPLSSFQPWTSSAT